MRTCLIFLFGIILSASDYRLIFKKNWSALSRDNFSSLADEPIMILCCFSWYVSLKFWIYSSPFLLLWTHFYWNTLNTLTKESIKSFCCFSIKISCFLSWYVSLNYGSSSSSYLLIWSHWSWKPFSVMAKESIKSFCSDIWLYGVFMDSDVFIFSCLKQK